MCQTHVCGAKLLTKGKGLIETKESHGNLTHRQWTTDQMITRKIQRETVEIACAINAPPKQACDKVVRDRPKDIKVMSECRDCKNQVYDAKRQTRFIMPKTREEIKSTLIKCKLDVNYHDDYKNMSNQKLQQDH